MSVIRPNFSLNYAWRQATSFSKPLTMDEIQCPIPDGLMANVNEIAERFPYTQNNIWVDIYGIGNHSNLIMNELNKMASAPNITFKPLDQISAYVTNPLFEIPSQDITHPHDPLWQQVDLLRLHVLREELSGGNFDGAVYADMDMDITEEVIERAGMIIDNFGFVAARKSEGAMIENQFFGLNRHQIDFLTYTLIGHTEDSIEEGKNGWYGHLKAVDSFQMLKLNGRSDNVMVVKAIKEAQRIKKSYQKAPSEPKRVNFRPKPGVAVSNAVPA